MNNRKVASIASLQELRQEKERLSRESDIAGKAIGKSFVNTQKVTGTFLLKKMVAPIGAAGLIFLLANKWRHQSGAEKSRKRQVAQPEQTVLERDAGSAPAHASAAAAPRLTVPTDGKRASSAPSEKEGTNWEGILNAGKFLIPLVRLIIGVVNQEVAKGSSPEQQSPSDPVPE